MKTKVLILLLLLILSLVIVGLAVANNGVALSRWVLGGGASKSTGGDTTVQASLGQPIVGAVSNGNVTLGQGFWHGGSGGYHIYLPLVQR